MKRQKVIFAVDYIAYGVDVETLLPRGIHVKDLSIAAMIQALLKLESGQQRCNSEQLQHILNHLNLRKEYVDVSVC